MRIISGRHKGKIIKAPKNLPVRPTTDYAKTGLFNILNNRIDFEKINFLDLFCGTGNISYEMISRGVISVTAVDSHSGCISFVNNTFKELNFAKGKAIKSDVIKFLEANQIKFDIIFADPPYAMENLNEVIDVVFNGNSLNKEGIFILEHQSKEDFSANEHFVELRKYSNVGFSFFQ